MFFCSKKKWFSSFYIIFISLFLILPIRVGAVDYQSLAPLPEINKVSFTGQPTDLSNYLNNMYKLIVGVAGVLAVLMIMWGGIEYMSTDAIGGKEEAKGRINNALLGLMIALGSYLILQTINKDFLNTTLNIDEVSTPELERIALIEQNHVPSEEDLSYDASLTDDDSADEYLRERLMEDGILAGEDGRSRVVEQSLLAAGDGPEHIVTKNINGLDGGNKGCAYGVCTVLTRAGVSGYENVTSTADLNARLSKDSRFMRVDASNSQAGDVFVGATKSATQIGHAVIAAGDSTTPSFSNRSSLGEFKATGESVNQLSKRLSGKGIDVYGYRLK